MVNGRTADIAITPRGSDLYFAICAAMGLAGFTFVGLAFRKQRKDRLFHYITAGVVFVACIAYFTMGSNLGFTPIEVEFKRNNPVVRGEYREIFYVRYIDWFITTRPRRPAGPGGDDRLHRGRHHPGCRDRPERLTALTWGPGTPSSRATTWP